MSGFRTENDDGSWLDATSVAQGAPTTQARDRQRKSRNRRVALFLVVLIVPFATFGLLRATDTHLPDAPSTEPSESLLIAGYVLSGIGFALTTIGLVRLIRAGMWGQAWRGPTLSLNRGDRRQLLRHIRHAEPVPAEQYTVTADLARRLGGQGPILLLLGGVLCSAAGQGLTSSLVFLRWLFAFVVVGELVVMIYARRDIHRARHWLKRFPTTT